MGRVIAWADITLGMSTLMIALYCHHVIINLLLGVAAILVRMELPVTGSPFQDGSMNVIQVNICIFGLHSSHSLDFQGIQVTICSVV